MPVRRPTLSTSGARESCARNVAKGSLPATRWPSANDQVVPLAVVDGGAFATVALQHLDRDSTDPLPAQDALAVHDRHLRSYAEHRVELTKQPHGPAEIVLHALE